ncbi:hypothetical protein [Aestuariispira ectoiniformans]|uniref:hypothetical protein n=1 Tax=Aestuariispira ectoiniformans TaxID=2775080 RepID=UPI00223ACC89|nr:hypothetical protein [Aestuariispira ectoiniformans]
MAKEYNYGLGHKLRTASDDTVASMTDRSVDRDIAGFRRLLKPYLEQLENRGRLGDTDETLDIVSAILEFHITKVADGKVTD